MPKIVVGLTIEQEFFLTSHRDAFDHIGKEDTKDMLLDTMRQLMIKDNIIKQLLKESLFREFN